jgi:hypothetical protein
MAKAVTAINRQVQALAAVINSPAVNGEVAVAVEPAEVSADLSRALKTGPVAISARRHGGATYVFAVRMEATQVKATFRVKGLRDGARVTVLGEERTLSARGDEFQEAFAAHGVHLYRIEP